MRECFEELQHFDTFQKLKSLESGNLLKTWKTLKPFEILKFRPNLGLPRLWASGGATFSYQCMFANLRQA